ncbi:MAG TPA: hypothetical protein VGP82_06905 [Ktedonobacterales bacterium]|jgi:hypothetical protein|nr:hypothetical protein [Ktedonobacterales bacterium]
MSADARSAATRQARKGPHPRLDQGGVAIFSGAATGTISTSAL